MSLDASFRFLAAGLVLRTHLDLGQVGYVRKERYPFTARRSLLFPAIQINATWRASLHSLESSPLRLRPP